MHAIREDGSGAFSRRQAMRTHAQWVNQDHLHVLLLDLFSAVITVFIRQNDGHHSCCLPLRHMVASIRSHTIFVHY